MTISISRSSLLTLIALVALLLVLFAPGMQQRKSAPRHAPKFERKHSPRPMGTAEERAAAKFAAIKANIQAKNRDMFVELGAKRR